MEKVKVGIVGVGMVGGAMKKYFEKKESVELYSYDKDKKEGSIKEVNNADIIFICVPTPWKDAHFDTSIVEDAIKNITGEKVIVIKSTVSIGTTDRLQKIFSRHHLLFNPEFLTEETADQDMNYPDRQIIGYASEGGYTYCGKVMHLLPLAPFEAIVPARQAEAVKLFGNSWFATKVALVNQFADVYKEITGDTDEDFQKVADMMAMDKRIGRTHLRIWHKGYRGYGGGCLPKDTRCVIEQAKGIATILGTVEEYNNRLLKNQEYGKDR